MCELLNQKCVVSLTPIYTVYWRNHPCANIFRCDREVIGSKYVKKGNLHSIYRSFQNKVSGSIYRARGTTFMWTQWGKKSYLNVDIPATLVSNLRDEWTGGFLWLDFKQCVCTSTMYLRCGVLLLAVDDKEAMVYLYYA